MMKQVGSRKKMILDLRGNRGGYLETEMYTASWFFDHDIKLGTEKERNKTKDRIIKGREDGSFKGELVVLIDSESASASEVFARVMQLEKRGRVMGDTSMGAVMTSLQFGLATNVHEPGF